MAPSVGVTNEQSVLDLCKLVYALTCATSSIFDLGKNRLAKRSNRAKKINPKVKEPKGDTVEEKELSLLTSQLFYYFNLKSLYNFLGHPAADPLMKYFARELKKAKDFWEEPKCR